MRTPVLIALAAIATAGSGCVTTMTYRQPVTSPHEAVVVDEFDAALSPWGHWLYVDGVRVWRPHAWVVGSAFTPYGTHGHWVHTDHGWSFESDFDWGWATFHYGRWMHLRSDGWVWVPGTRWAPAWVTWRHGGGYIGWAPMAPDWVVVDSPWVFVQTRHFVAHDLYRYSVPRTRRHTVWSNTRPIDSRVHGASWGIGPSPRTIEHAAGSVPRARIAPPPPGRVERHRTSWASPPPPGRIQRPLPPAPRGEPRRPAPNQILTPPRGDSFRAPSGSVPRGQSSQRLRATHPQRPEIRSR